MPTSSEEAAAAAAAAAAEAAFREFAIEAWTLLAVAILVTVVRTLARVRAVGWAQLRPDDYLVWVGLVRFPFLVHSHLFVSMWRVRVCCSHIPNSQPSRYSTPRRLRLHTALELPLGGLQTTACQIKREPTCEQMTRSFNYGIFSRTPHRIRRSRASDLITSRVTGSKIQVAGWSTYSVLLWSFKASVLFFYIRLTVQTIVLPYKGSVVD
jgi:hypothetical protein